jgi:energy-coupling factor transporter transmembrane protein EcfT
MPRTLPWSSPAHRLWAGTKAAALVCVVLALAARPTWPTLSAALLVLGGWAVAARLPRSVLPCPPRWFAAAIAVTAILVALGGGLLALQRWALFAGITAVSLIGALMLIWTTPLAEIPPLVQRLAHFARRARLPVTGWASTVSLGLRLLPLLQSECATVIRTATQRASASPTAKQDWRDQRRQAVHAITLCCCSALRRAAEMAEAITARGGLGVVADAGQRPGRRDLFAFAAVLSILALGCLIG